MFCLLKPLLSTKMDKQQEKKKPSLRAKSPIIMSNRQKMALFNSNEQSTSKIQRLNESPKKIQETKVPIKTTVHPLKTLKHLNLNRNLQSTPNTRNVHKSMIESRIVMNLSPIVSSVEKNLNCRNDIFQHKLDSLDQSNKQDSSNVNAKLEFNNKLKPNKIMSNLSNDGNILDSPMLPVNTRKIDEDKLKEKTKRCLFEKENANNISNVDTDQDSLNISLDILEQVCQVSEIMDYSLTEEIKINDSEKKKEKLAFFLYGDNNTTKLDDNEKENELLQLALSMEDNFLNETKSENKISSDGEFTSLNQLNIKGINLSVNNTKVCNNNEAQINVFSDSKFNFQDHAEIDNIGNTQMCEIADITEPLESFDDKWTQQYLCNESNFTKEKKENISCNNYLQSNQIKSSNNLTINQDNNIANSNMYKGFSTAGGKSIKVSAEALCKVESLLKDEFNDSPTSIKDKNMNSNVCDGFLTSEGKSSESFDDKWTQQYLCNESNLTNEKKEKKMYNNYLHSNQMSSSNSLTIPKDNNVTNSNLCKGFSTAGGKSIKVSKEALHKVKSLLKDEFNDFSTSIKDETFMSSNICKGFSTAGGKSIKVSVEALHKVQSLLKDELGETPSNIKNKTMEISNICKGFSTASGKSIKVSNEALYKVQSLLKDEINDSSTSIKDNNIMNSNICDGFLIAAGKSVQSFDDKWTQQYLCNESKFTNDKNEKKINNNYLHSNQMSPGISLTIPTDNNFMNSNLCKGFSTAGGKSIKVSKEALNKVQSLLKDEFNDSSTCIKDETIMSSNICKGFSTAGGKSIKVSNEALHKVQSLLKDEFYDSSTSIKHNNIMNSNICDGFLTAAGKSVESFDDKWTQQYLLNESNFINKKKEKKMCNNYLHSNQMSPGISLTIPTDSNFMNSNLCKGFSTARGKSIKVSKEALNKVQSLLKDEFNVSSTCIKDETIMSSNISKGFSTAGGKSIKVSNEALHKVQSLLKDEIGEISTNIKNKTTANSDVVCKGFSTAGGKSTKVSDEALHKIQLLLKDDFNDSSTIIKDKTVMSSNTCKGFSTAGGQCIKVSDKALQKVQLLLKDEEKESQLLSNSYKVAISDHSDFNTSKSTIISKSNINLFETLNSEEECALEDVSLVDTIEKFEKEHMVYKPVLRNKRPGSPMYEMNHKIKKIVHDEGWERDVLKSSFDEYLSKKLTGPKVSLPESVNWILPKIHCMKQFPENNIESELFKLNIDNALNLKLCWEKDFKLSDGCKNKMYSFEDIKQFFLTHQLVDVKLIPKGWINNHFCLIVWKLAATEISFPDHFGKKLLTAKNVTHQLLYRYYTEIEKCKRSSLKKILEKDETATKRIILCVSRVVKENTADTYNIELTDGWYSVQALIDSEMNTLLQKGIVKVGTKLIICNAELIGAGDGIDPLEVHDGVKLKISTNSTRRVRWYAKLGFYKYATLPIPITLESVLPRGGIIGSLSFVILRKYPLMFLERKENSKSILRNEKMEAIEAEKYEAYQQKSLEIISNKIETELIAEMASTTKKSKNHILSVKKENLDKLSLDELSNVIENSTDPLEIQSLLSQEKIEDLKNFKNIEQEKFYNELKNRVNKVFNDQFKDTRKVIPLLKLRIVDEKHASTGFKSGILTIWNPSEDVSTILNTCIEGQCCTCHNLNTNGFINGELHLSANKNSRFNFKGFKIECIKRDVVNFKSLWSGIFFPLFGELDFVGIVVSDVNKNNSSPCEIYVSDKEMNIISILFRSDIKDYGCDDMMYPGNIISGVNIQFRGFNKISSMPKLYTSEHTSFTSVPKNEYLIKVFDDYKMFMKKSENQDFLSCCQNKLEEICRSKEETMTTNNDSSNQQSSKNISKNELNRSCGETSISVLNISNTTQSEFSPAQKRIKMLKSYGKTPPLNIVHTKPPDKKLLGQFKTPNRL